MSPLFPAGQGQGRMADLKVSTLQEDVVAAVYRDMVNENKGYLMLGRAAPEGMQWHPPVLFSNQQKAFSPVFIKLNETRYGKTGGFAIAFRNADRGGDGLLVGGRISHKSGKVTLGTPKAFARHQAQAMELVSLPDSHVAVIFAEHSPRVNGEKALDMYGTALLAQISADDGPMEIKSKDRFATGPVARLSVAPLSPTSFGIAYRQGGGEEGAEAAAIVGELHKSHIRFNSAAALLEPKQAHILARSLSLVGESTLAYTYHSADEKVTKQAILRDNPKSHRLEVVHGPVVLAQGFSSVLGSAAFSPQNSKEASSLLLTVLGHNSPKPAEARLCRISSSGSPGACINLEWEARNLASVSATQVSDGRIVLLSTDSSGNPYYQIAGLAA